MPALLADPELSQMMLLTIGTVIALATVFYMQWVMTQRRQEKREEEKFQMERKRFEFELHSKTREAEYEEELGAEKSKADERAREAAAGNAGVDQDVHGRAGVGSGGFIIMDMPDKDRPLFHDLLKGFEDFARLKGYLIAFSIDSTFAGRIAFKFTIKDDGIVVGAERVRRDFAEYVNQVRNKDIDDLDNLPVVTSLEEHHLLMTVLKNRITFLKHNYQLSQNAVQFYEKMMSNSHSFPALPAPSVIVHTGGAMDSRNYNAVNSQKVLQGDGNSLTDNSINIGQSFNERQERIAALDELIGKLKTSEVKDGATEKAEKALMKVRDEIADEPEPNTGMIKKWLEAAKNTLGTAGLSYEVVEVGKKVWEMFGS